MKLLEEYLEIEKRVKTIDYSHLLKGFNPIEFAIYNDEDVCLNGALIKKTDEFLANTSILYQGRYIAIFKVFGNENLDVITSKIVHEMYHAYQNINNDKRYPNEMDALINYEYKATNLYIKTLEGILLKELLDKFEIEKYKQFLAIRRYRSLEYPHLYKYESMVEEIEGCANYIELKVLEQLDINQYKDKLNEITSNIVNIDMYFPIRIVSYDFGAAILKVLIDNNIPFNEEFNDETKSDSIIKDVEAIDLEIDDVSDIEFIIQEREEINRNVIKKTLLENDLVLSGDYVLLYVNVYDAVKIDMYVISTYFVAYMADNKPEFLYGDFVIVLNDENRVKEIYRIRKDEE